MKLDYRVYRRAAERIKIRTGNSQNSYACCEAIRYACWNYDLSCELSELHETAFKSFMKRSWGYWFDEDDFELQQLQRTIALLLMAEYVRTDL